MFGVMRIKKHSNDSGLVGMSMHNKREIPTPNADPLRTKNNIEVVGTGNYRTDVNNHIKTSGGMIQKNGVKAVEHMISASPEYFEASSVEEQQKKIATLYYASKAALTRFYGADSKIVSCSLHLDEKTPHFHLFIVPAHKSKLKGGKEVLRIGARKFLGDHKQLSKLQDVFGEEIAALGLQRGVKKSKAQHVSPRKYYALQNQKNDIVERHKITIPKIEKPGRFIMNLDQWAIEQSNRIAEAIEPKVKVINGALNSVATNSLHQDLHFFSGKMKLELDKKQNKIKELEAEIERIKKTYTAQDAVVSKYRQEANVLEIKVESYEVILEKIVNRVQLLPTELTLVNSLKDRSKIKGR